MPYLTRHEGSGALYPFDDLPLPMLTSGSSRHVVGSPTQGARGVLWLLYKCGGLVRPGPGQPGGSLHSGHTTCQWVGQVARWPGGLVAVGLRWPMIRRLPHGSSVATSPLPRNLILCCSQPGWSGKWSERTWDWGYFLKKNRRDKKDVRNKKALGGWPDWWNSSSWGWVTCEWLRSEEALYNRGNGGWLTSTVDGGWLSRRLGGQLSGRMHITRITTQRNTEDFAIKAGADAAT